MRTFGLHRFQDESGVSGTGRVAEGVQFSDGRCVMVWLTQVSSMAFYQSLEDLEAIHGHGGKTRVVFDDPTRIGLKAIVNNRMR